MRMTGETSLIFQACQKKHSAVVLWSTMLHELSCRCTMVGGVATISWDNFRESDKEMSTVLNIYLCYSIFNVADNLAGTPQKRASASSYLRKWWPFKCCRTLQYLPRRDGSLFGSRSENETPTCTSCLQPLLQSSSSGNRSFRRSDPPHGVQKRFINYIQSCSC